MDAAFGVMIEKGGGHLGASGVVHAHEEDLGNIGHDASFSLGETPCVILWHHDVVGVLAHRRIKRMDDHCRARRADQLENHEGRRRRWSYAGKGVAQCSGEGDGRIGEAGGRGEEVGAADVGADGEGRG